MPKAIPGDFRSKVRKPDDFDAFWGDVLRQSSAIPLEPEVLADPLLTSEDVFRGIVADGVRGLEFLLTRREVDAARVVVAGNDLALITAALTAGATHVVATPALFYKTAELAPEDPGVSARRDQRLPSPVPGARRGGAPHAGQL